ncbi:hypothetical protein A4X13_0g271 [Tilletia indica]|uniref:O-methyltransferase C-terminal domain-containing protein n=1 Tax=Tilletia indica TaxID=43049 RepID=A0A177TIM2_9BASI|nr:hypothetical protein A4X13_0g271 [Tilletia indica]
MSSPQPSYAYLRALSNILNQSLATYESHLSFHNADDLDLENPQAKRPDDASKSMAEARWACLNTLDVLRAALQSPVDAMYQTHTSAHELAALGVIVKFGVVECMYKAAKDSGNEMAGVPAEILANNAGMNTQKLERLLRLLAVRHWFRETSEGCFRPTRHGAALRKGESVAAYIAAQTPTIFASMHELPNTLTDPLSRDSDSEHQTAFARGPGQGKSFWEYLSDHPNMKRDFGLSMQASGEIQLAASLREFPWRERLQDKVLVDVGGGAGHFSVHFAKMDVPGLNIVVQDLPGTFELAQEHFTQTVPQFVAEGRAEFEQGDFFAPNSRSGANVCYLLRSILHDWSDEHCVKILSNLAGSMHPDSSIFVHDALLRPCLPPNPTSQPSAPPSPVLDHPSESGFSHNAMLRRASLLTPPRSDVGEEDGDAAATCKSPDTEASNATKEAPWPIPRNFGPNASQVCGLDFLMLLELNGRERTEAQIRNIAERAGLQLVHTTSLTSGRGIFEIRLPF